MLPQLEVCLQRIQKRNGGKPIKEDMVRDKWKTVERNVKHFKDAGFTSLVIDNSNLSKENTVEWFLKSLNLCAQGNALYVEPRENLTKYDWYPDYKEPDDTVILDQKYFDNFWYNFSKVKGHGENYWNNECDRLAQIEAQQLKDNFRGEQNG